MEFLQSKFTEIVQLIKKAGQFYEKKLADMEQQLVAKDDHITELTSQLSAEREEYKGTLSTQAKFFKEELLHRESRIDYYTNRAKLDFAEVDQVRIEKAAYVIGLAKAKKELQEVKFERDLAIMRLQHESDQLEKVKAQLQLHKDIIKNARPFDMASCDDESEKIVPLQTVLSYRNKRCLHRFKSRLSDIKGYAQSISEDDEESSDSAFESEESEDEHEEAEIETEDPLEISTIAAIHSNETEAKSVAIESIQPAVIVPLIEVAEIAVQQKHEVAVKIVRQKPKRHLRFTTILAYGISSHRKI